MHSFTVSGMAKNKVRDTSEGSKPGGHSLVPPSKDFVPDLPSVAAERAKALQLRMEVITIGDSIADRNAPQLNDKRLTRLDCRRRAHSDT
jgi:hypothetical protein